MSEQEKRPILESYWVVPGRLLAGEYPAQFNEEVTRKRLGMLIEAGFDLFIDLTKPGEAWSYHRALLEEAKAREVEVIPPRRFPIGDFGIPTSEQMNSILDTLDASVQSGRKIYLHCLGGIGRTGTTVGCYLVRHGKTGAEALSQLASWWRDVPKSRDFPRSPETGAQANFILHWSEQDKTLKKRMDDAQ